MVGANHYGALSAADVISAFAPYRPDGFTSKRAITNLHDKLNNPDFRSDLLHLITKPVVGYEVDTAGLVMRLIRQGNTLLSLLQKTDAPASNRSNARDLSSRYRVAGGPVGARWVGEVTSNSEDCAVTAIVAERPTAASDSVVGNREALAAAKALLSDGIVLERQVVDIGCRESEPLPLLPAALGVPECHLSHRSDGHLLLEAQAAGAGTYPVWLSRI